MSRKDDGPRFIFHGIATPFGARIEGPNPRFVKGPPSAALPVCGGWNLATSTGACCDDIFKWGVTVADCKGDQEGDNFVTAVACGISDVVAKNDPIVFRARTLRIRVVSTHGAPGTQPKIVPTETLFDGLTIDGEPIMVAFDDALIACPTFDEYMARYYADAPPQRTRSGYVLTSFVRNVSFRGDSVQGNVLRVKGFGNIIFGEVLMQEDSRRITMVRLEMGCTTQAQAAMGEVDHNGGY